MDEIDALVSQDVNRRKLAAAREQALHWIHGQNLELIREQRREIDALVRERAALERERAALERGDAVATGRARAQAAEIVARARRETETVGTRTRARGVLRPDGHRYHPILDDDG
eukprot:COSAG04_NODE_2323_length_4332_cov_8.915595_6_plen_114_part_01